MSSKPTVVARNVSKTFQLSKDGSERSILSGLRQTKVEALHELSLVAYSGECIGLIGRNGSGKSTLLNLIAGSEKPTTGEIFVSSQPTHLGVSAALQGHLSGRANVNLGLLAMGLSPEQARSLVPSVLEWTELEDAADRPMRTYSSGMRSRLKFGISTAVKREILLVDEALSTGDSAFAAKASKRMEEFLEDAGTVFLVSHSAGVIEKFCNRAIWLHDGRLIGDGAVSSMTKMYRSWSKRMASEEMDKASWIIEQRMKTHKDPVIVFEDEAAALLDYIENPR